METCQNHNTEDVNRDLKIRTVLKDYVDNLDSNLKLFCRLVRKDQRDEKDYVIAITGYPGLGKSQLSAVLGMLIDHNYSFDKNICFIPTSKEIKEQYLNLPMYSVLHVDEASRGMHKHKWHDKMQQTLNELYDTDREGHFLCTLLLMPRFQNFTENFRNFRIKYWININDRGLAVVYKRDEDKDAKDPWHLDENYKLKQKQWKNKKIYDRSIPEVIRMEQRTLNYWFYFTLPALPKEVWDIYQHLKRESRILAKKNEEDLDIESHKDRLDREKKERWATIAKLKSEGKTHEEIGAILGVTSETVRRNVKSMSVYNDIFGGSKFTSSPPQKEQGNLYKQDLNTKFKKIKPEFIKEQNVEQQEQTME